MIEGFAITLFVFQIGFSQNFKKKRLFFKNHVYGRIELLGDGLNIHIQKDSIIIQSYSCFVGSVIFLL